MAMITDQLGRVLAGRYRLDAGLGTGASAHVYLAMDTRLSRRVAVKLLHPGLASDQAFLRRFRQEAQLVASFNHPNLLRVYDWGEEHDGPFLVLEYLAGGSLRDLLDAGRLLSPQQAALIGAQAAAGLSYAHRRGLVHRDIKPANLLFDEEGTVRVADFGIARALVEAAWTEPEGTVLGTARYASPEQAESKVLDDKSDVYSLALVLYEALTGRVPFSADTTVATLLARLNKPLPPARELGPLTPILAQATISDPVGRFDAHELAIELEQVGRRLPRPEALPLAPPRLYLADDPARDPHRTILTPPDNGGASTGDLTTIGAVAAPGAAAFYDDEHDPYEAKAIKRRWPRRVALGVAAVLALAIAAGAIVRFAVFDHKVPRLSGQSLAAARQQTSSAGLGLVVDRRRYSSTTPAGAVISQSPTPGSLERRGVAVHVVVSKGIAPVLVPKVVGMSEKSAEAALSAKHFVAVATQSYSSSVPSGTVITESPAGGLLKYHSKVAIVVSLGPAPVTIPNLGTDTYEQAASALSALGLKPSEQEAYSTSVPSGEIISTSPAEGSQNIPVGTAVTVTISKGPQLVPIPSVAGDSVEEAVSVLKGAGFDNIEVFGPPNAQQAVTTDPGPGTPESTATQVTLYAS